MEIPMHLLGDKGLAFLLAYWDSRRGDRACPARSDIDPIDMKAVLPNVFLIDVLHGPLRFRFRLVGTGVVKRRRRDDTGRMLDDLEHVDMREVMRGQFKQAVVRSRPVCYENVFPLPSHKQLAFRSLLLPLSRDGQTVDMLLGGMGFDVPMARENAA